MSCGTRVVRSADEGLGAEPAPEPFGHRNSDVAVEKLPLQSPGHPTVAPDPHIECLLGDGDLVLGGIRAGVARPQLAGERLACLVEVGKQRVKAISRA